MPRRVTWVSKAQIRFFEDHIWPRYEEFVVDEVVLKPSPRTGGGLFFLLDVSPVGGWKGKNWAIYGHRPWNVEYRVHWYRSREEAEIDWQEGIAEAARQDAENPE